MKKINVKTIAIILVILMALAAILIFGYIVYKNIFAGVRSKRLDGIENHPLTKEEIAGVKEEYSVLTELDSVNIEVNKNSKIIKIKVVLTGDVEFEILKGVCNKSIEKITEDNLSFYDLEVFVTTKTESEIYPQIGYKHRSNTVFSW